ncbi:MAG: adenosylhomocysteinase [Ignavibacteriales bacterium]|nr:adenosylhomocysteinase [Ignavibacteriales bacterium]
MENDFIVRDINLAPKGQMQIDWVSNFMPVLDGLYEKLKTTGVFKNKKIALCIHLEAKTAYLALIIKKLGAEVWVTSSNSLSAKDEVAAALAKNGIHVYAKHAATSEEYWSFLESILKNKMDVTVDDGGDICEYLHEHPEYAENIRGICEETTTGVNRLKELEKAGKLKYPAIAINDAKSKHLFDNRFGTGQSTWTAITHLTNMNVAGKIVVVAGYGWVGKGVAERADGMGAEVIVTEIDPWKALEARMDGHRVMMMADAAPLGDFFVTTTGFSSIIRMEHILKMKNGAFLSNAGHFDFEIDIPALKKSAVSHSVVRDEVEEYALDNGKKVYVLARGGIINIAGGLGHPADIMDMSFSVQLGCLNYFLSSGKLEPKLYKVPDEIDRMVTEEKLKAEGITIDK